MNFTEIQTCVLGSGQRLQLERTLERLESNIREIRLLAVRCSNIKYSWCSKIYVKLYEDTIDDHNYIINDCNYYLFIPHFQYGMYYMHGQEDPERGIDIDSMYNNVVEYLRSKYNMNNNSMSNNSIISSLKN